MNAITLTIGGTTKTIQAWGFTYCTLHLKSRAPSTLILNRGGDLPESGPVIAYGTTIIAQIAMGDGSTYFWQGKRRDFNGQAHPDAPRTSYQFEDVWGALSRTIFQHYWQMSNGATGVINQYFSRLNLFQDIHAGPGVAWAYLTADNQICQIIEFARDQCGLPVTVGEVDPIWNMPVVAVKAITCAEALQLVLKPMPDMVTQMDYSTTPPTAHFKTRQNSTPVTLPYAGTDIHGRSHKQSTIKPRPDLQVPSVNIQYQLNGTIDGVAYNSITLDNYPPFSTGLAENALVFPIDLRGPSRTDVKATLVTEAVDPTNAAFWLEHKPDLDDAKICLAGTNTPGVAIKDTTINGGGGHPEGITILDSDGATVDLADYPNKLISGQPASWMTVDGFEVEAFEVTIRATLKYDKIQPGTSTADQKLNGHVVEVRLRLTDAPAGATNYTVTGSSDSGDPIPLHLAYVLWCSINNVPINYVGGSATPPGSVPPVTNPDNFQWEGEHEIVENAIYSIITPANTLNLSGGDPDWTSMNAVIYSVDIDFFAGRTNISFGPFKHLQAAQYFEMIMAFRYRQVFDNPNLRNTGQSGSAGATDLGKNSPKENTTEQLPDHGKHTTQSEPDGGGLIVKIQQDAVGNGGQILAQTYDSSGAPTTSGRSAIQLTLNDLGTVDDLGTTGRVAQFRKIVCLDLTGTPQQYVVACSDAEDTDVTISGGAFKGVINTVSGNPDIYANYFIVNTGSNTTSATFSNGVTSITVSSATGIAIGQLVTGTHIAAHTLVTSVSGTTIGISNATTGTSSGTYTFTGLVRVAKNPKLRCGIASESIDMATWTYTYGGSSPYTNVTRKAVSGAVTEYQVVVPRYLPADEVWYIPVDNGAIGSMVSVSDTISSSAGTAITLMDLNADGRTWCARASQTGYENT